MADAELQTEVANSAADEVFYSGVAQLNAGDFRGAIETFRSAFQDGTDFPAPTHAYTGVAWFELKRIRLYASKKPFRSRPWLDRYRYRLQTRWLEKQRQSGHGESSRK